MRYPSLVSTPQPETQIERKPCKAGRTGNPLTNPEKLAIVAACAVPGAHKGNIAKQFGVRREVISRLLADVRLVQNPANPLADDFKPAVKHEAWQAVRKGMAYKRDPYKAASVGLRVLEGSGELNARLDIDASVAIQVSWLPAQDSAQCIDVTPSQVVDNTQDQT